MGKQIVAIVRFDLPEGMTAEEAAKLFEASAPRYVGVDGLIRKYYILDGDQSGVVVTSGRTVKKPRRFMVTLGAAVSRSASVTHRR